MNARPAIFALLLVGLLVASGCASSGSRSQPQTGSTTLIVDNQLIPSVNLRIYVLPSGSGSMRTFVGTVNPGARATLRFDPPPGSQFVLVADVSLGNNLVSPVVGFSPGETIEWDVRSNLVRVRTAQ